MSTRSYQLPELHRSSVIAAIDARIEDLGRLDESALAFEVILDSNTLERSTAEMRRTGLLRAITDVIDCHGWSAEWDPRGVRLRHGQTTLVLGLPANLTDYLTGREGA